MLLRLSFCLSGDAFGDREQPRQVDVPTDEPKRTPQMMEIDRNSCVSACWAAPLYVVGDSLSIDPCFRCAGQQRMMLGRDEAEVSTIAGQQRPAACFGKVRGCPA